jgi:hypothetical protein
VGGSTDARERPADDDATVGLCHGGENAAALIEFEVRVDRAVGIQARDVIANNWSGCSARLHAREMTANDHLAVELVCKGIDRAIQGWGELAVERAVGTETRDIRARADRISPTPNGRERAAHENRAIQLERNRRHVALHARDEFGIDRTVEIQPRNMDARCSRFVARRL